jgi:DNA primase
MPRMIPEADLERVKAQTDLLALVRSRGVELKPHGTKDYVGRCPFHADRETPNFIVTPDKGLWHCMACGLAGNAIQFIQRHDGISFRHAFELLAQGHHPEGCHGVYTAQPLAKQSTVPRLPCPLDPEADDATLFGQVLAYYHERLKSLPTATGGRAYLASRGLDSEALIDRFQLGFADRTLGLRLPEKNRREGEVLRTRLTRLGLWRESGHEHFNGCVVVPFHNEAGQPVRLYGRRVQRGDLRHLYQPGPHQGLFNREALQSPEIILCEAVIDALTFWANGLKNVTCLFGTEGFTEELWQAILKHRVQRVRLAYDADEAGERAAARDAERFQAHGIEVFRIQFPHGMDANEYALDASRQSRAGGIKPADQSLSLLVNGAAWLGKGAGARFLCPPSPSQELVSMAKNKADALPVVPVNGEACLVPSLVAAALLVAEASAEVPTPAGTSRLGANAAKEKAAENPPASALEKSGVAALAASVPPGEMGAGLACRGEAWFLDLEGREYRVAGLEKTLGTDALKITLRLRVPLPTRNQEPGTNNLYHLDQVDLSRDQERRRFIERAAEETGLTPELLKRDLGKLLLAVEQAQAELAKPQDQTARGVTLSPEEREEALAWLKAPDLIARLRKAFHQSGLIGEENNTLIAYLACVSRKLERPLAIIIQSASAAGKTTLMDAVLSFFPEEDRVKYSAMTGQSLYYLGETSLQHKILAVVEEAGAEKAAYALKLLQSEGELTIASTGKDPQTGRMVTQEYHVEGPTMLFLTTTAVDLDEELQNRCLTLTVDESIEQTERIHRRQRERRTLAGLIAREERRDLLRQLGNAQRLLAPISIINPFAPALTFPTGRTRNRRDHEKYLTLIDAIALLHQYQRPQQAVPAPHAPGGAPVGAGSACFIEVTLDDIALANQLAPEVLGRSLDELPPQTCLLLGHIRQLVKNRKAGEAGTRFATGPPSQTAGVKVGAGFACFSRKELREACGWSLTQVSVHLERLVALEYVALRHGRLGSPFVYELLIDPDTPEPVAPIGLIDVESLRRAKPGYGCDSPVSGFPGGVPGLNSPVTGGNQTGPIPPTCPSTKALERR